MLDLARLNVAPFYTWTPKTERNRQVAADYVNGESLATLSQKYGVSRERVRQLLERAGVKMRPQGSRYMGVA